MASIFDLIRLNLFGLSYATEFLESCDWDEEIMSEKVETLKYILVSLPVDGIKENGFNSWVDTILVPTLKINGFSDIQAKILVKVIFNSREELILHANSGDYQ